MTSGLRQKLGKCAMPGARKDPGPEGPALVHPGGVIWVINFTSSVQVSGFGCQVSATEVGPLGRSRS
jgi:hypothetical protein